MLAEHQRLGNLGLHPRPVEDRRDHQRRAGIPGRQIVDRADQRRMAGTHELACQLVHPAPDHSDGQVEPRRDLAHEPADTRHIGVEPPADEQQVTFGFRTGWGGRGGRLVLQDHRRDRVGGAAV